MKITELLRYVFVITALVFSLEATAESPLRTLETTAAATKKVKMKMDLSMDGRLVASQEIVSALNSLATVTQKNQNGKELVVEVNSSLASVKGREGVHMKFRLGQRQTDSDGKTSQVTWFASPEITALNRQEAEIKVETASATDGRRNYTLKVLPTLE